MPTFLGKLWSRYVQWQEKRHVRRHVLTQSTLNEWLDEMQADLERSLRNG